MTVHKTLHRADLVRVARTNTSMAHLMLHDAIDQAAIQGHHAGDCAAAQEKLAGMFLTAQMSHLYPDYRDALADWTSGKTSTIALRDLYEQAFDAPYMESRDTRNVVNLIDNAWLAVNIAKSQLEEQDPMAQLAVDLGANIFDIVNENDARFATGFCAASTHMMRAAELAQFEEILAEQRVAREAAPEEDDMRP